MGRLSAAAKHSERRWYGTDRLLSKEDHVSMAVTTGAAGTASRPPDGEVDDVDHVDRRVLLELVTGAPTTAIADRLGLTVAQVRTRLRDLRAGFGAPNNLALAAAVVRAGVIE
jgi:DNA-binding CsgD family transcriptional regulator